MIEFRTQIDNVHNSIYGHNDSTSHNQGETRSASSTQRQIQARCSSTHLGGGGIGVTDYPRIEDQHEPAFQLAQMLQRRISKRRFGCSPIGAHDDRVAACSEFKALEAFDEELRKSFSGIAVTQAGRGNRLGGMADCACWSKVRVMLLCVSVSFWKKYLLLIAQSGRQCAHGEPRPRFRWSLRPGCPARCPAPQTPWPA